MKAARAFANWHKRPDSVAVWASACAGSAEAIGQIGAWLVNSGLSLPGVPVGAIPRRKGTGRPVGRPARPLSGDELALGRACAVLMDRHGITARCIEKATMERFRVDGGKVYWQPVRYDPILVTPEISECLRALTRFNRAEGEPVVFLTKKSPTSTDPIPRQKLIHLASRARKYDEGKNAEKTAGQDAA